MSLSIGLVRQSSHVSWRRALGSMAAFALIVLAACWRDASDAVAIWSSSTAYTHCFLVVPMAVVLAMQPGRWERISSSVPVPDARWLVLVPVVSAGWLVADRLGIAEGRQLCVVAGLVVGFVAILGSGAFRAAAAPILYLFLLVPVGEFLVPALQSVTMWFITTGLDAIGLMYFNDGLSIDIPEGRFYVAEACAGLRFLIACVAFGVTYSLVFYRSWPRRIAFCLAALAVPIVANGFRALGIVYLGHVLGSAEAAAVDHLLYGYIFFSIVVGALAVAGYPFVQRLGRPSSRIAVAVGPVPRRFLQVGVVAGVAFALVPVSTGALDAASATVPVPFQIDLGPVSGCSGSGQSYDCAGVPVAIEASGLPGRSVPDVVARFGHRVAGFGESTSARGDSDPSPWRVLVERETGSAFAVAFLLDGSPSPGGVRERLELARDSLLPRSCVPTRVVARAGGPDPRRSLAALQSFVAATGPGGGLVAAVRRPACRGAA